MSFFSYLSTLFFLVLGLKALSYSPDVDVLSTKVDLEQIFSNIHNVIQLPQVAQVVSMLKYQEELVERGIYLVLSLCNLAG